MKKNLLTAVVAALLCFASVARADVDAVKAEGFIKKTTAEGIEQIINANISQAEKDKRFYAL